MIHEILYLIIDIIDNILWCVVNWNCEVFIDTVTGFINSLEIVKAIALNGLI
jgi:hypothetical protein